MYCVRFPADDEALLLAAPAGSAECAAGLDPCRRSLRISVLRLASYEDRLNPSQIVFCVDAYCLEICWFDIYSHAVFQHAELL